MSFAISQEDIDALRAYVTAKDGHEYDDVEPGIVCFDITHNYLKVRMHGVRMPLSATVSYSGITSSEGIRFEEEGRTPLGNTGCISKVVFADAGGSDCCFVIEP